MITSINDVLRRGFNLLAVSVFVALILFAIATGLIIYQYTKTTKLMMTTALQKV